MCDMLLVRCFADAAVGCESAMIEVKGAQEAQRAFLGRKPCYYARKKFPGYESAAC
jgi:hypothetical protein